MLSDVSWVMGDPGSEGLDAESGRLIYVLLHVVGPLINQGYYTDALVGSDKTACRLLEYRQRLTLIPLREPYLCLLYTSDAADE